MNRSTSGPSSLTQIKIGVSLILSLAPLTSIITDLAAQEDLSIDLRENNTLEIAWPHVSLEQELEESPNLQPDSWTRVDSATDRQGNLYKVILGLTDSPRFYRIRRVVPEESLITKASPANESEGIAVTRETVIYFNTPLSEKVKAGDTVVWAEFAGEKLPSRNMISADRKSISLFYDEYLPGGSKIKVFINGDELTDLVGRKIDADNDGIAGGLGKLEFTTLSLATIPGTAVIGNVYAAEQQLVNEELVDVPLEGVKVFLDGKEQTVSTTTDSEGFFKLEPVPSGEFFVHIYGWTASGSDYPDGAYYPFIGKAWTAIPGKDDNLAGGTGKVYLPLIQGDSLVEVSATEDTQVGFSQEIVADNPELEGVFITVPANSLLGAFGERGGRVGLAPVPPDRTPEPLPEMLQFPLVITVQTDGALNFDTPAPVCFPNLPDPETGEMLSPGAKTGLWSFNHDSGKWELQGSMTISEDGLFAISDPGVGITAPGWHGTNPDGDGDGGGGGDDDEDDNDDDDKPDPDDDPNRDPCRRIRQKAKSAGMQCLNSLVTAIPVFGCAGAIITGVGGTALDCHLDGSECHTTVLKQTVGTLISCIPVYGGGAGVAYNCLYGGGSALSDYQQCKTDNNTDRNSGFPWPELQFDSPGEIPHNGFIKQAELWLAAAQLYELAYGHEEWTLIDPEEWLIAEPFFDLLAVFGDPNSEDGEGFSQTEKETLAQLERPSNITEEILLSSIDRMDRMGRNTLTSEELDNDAVIAALENLLAILEELESRGWVETWDGILGALQDMVNEENSFFEGSQGGVQSNGFSSFDNHDQPSYTRRGGLHYQTTNLFNKFVQRGQLDESGQFDGLFLSADTYYRIDYTDPRSSEIATTVFKSGGPGTTTQIPATVLVEDDSDDSDGDGLKDAIEQILGTDILDADSDNDGVSDYAEILNGTNPLDGIALPNGILASIEMEGRATFVDVAEDVAVLARDSDGIGVVDISNPLDPKVLADVRVPGEQVRFIGAWRNRAFASGRNREVYFLNIRNPSEPVLSTKELLTISGPAGMCVYGPYGYLVGSNNVAEKVDLRTQELLWTQTVDPFVHDVQVSRGLVYILFYQSFNIYRETEDGLELLGSVPVAGDQAPLETGTKLFVGGDYAYYGHFTGYGVIDISDPTTPIIVGTPPETQLAVHDLVTSGSGHRLIVSSFTGTHTLALTVYDGSDPTVVNETLVEFETPGDTRGVVMHQGLALVSDTEEDMQVINFLGLDPLEEAPSLVFETPFEAELMQVENDEPTWLYIDVSDNHMVRNVELYLDDKLYSNDGNFPFEFVYIPPSLTENKDSYTARVRAYDMSGFITDSEVLTINVVDTTPPFLFDMIPVDGGFHYEEDEVDRVSVFSNELLDSSAFDGNTFMLLEAGEDKTFDTADDQSIAGTVAFDPETFEISLSLDAPLTKGIYQASVSPVSDISGNLFDEITTWTFDIRGPNVWISDAGGVFGAAENWSEGGIRSLDRLTIDVAGDPVVISYNSGSYSMETLHSEEIFSVNGRPFTLIEEAVINDLFIWKGQSTFDGGGILWANGGMNVESSSNKFLRNMQINVGGNSTWTDGSILFWNSNGKLEYDETSILEINNENFINLVEGSSDGDPLGVINHGAIIKRGPGEFRISNLAFQHTGSIDVEEGTFEVFGSDMSGPGTIVVRDGAAFAARGGSTRFGGFPILETPPHIEEGGTLRGHAGYMETADGIGITGSGIIDLTTGIGTSATFGFTLVVNGDVTAKHLNMITSSNGVFNGNTTFETVDMNINDQGSLGGTGIVDITEDLIWTYGYMDGGGITRLRGPTTISQDFGLGLGDRTLEIYDTFTANGGFMRILSGSKSTVHVMPGGTFFHKDDFQFHPGGSYWDTWIINEGTYTKEGDVGITQNRVSIENRGTFNLDYGHMRVDWQYIQTDTGILNLPIRDAPDVDNSFGSIAYGDTRLDGTLNIQLAEGFIPEIGASYRILAGGSQSTEGTFATITGLDIAADRKFELQYSSNNRWLDLVAVEVAP